jgi:hypothetical protein
MFSINTDFVIEGARAWYSPNGHRFHSNDACYATLMGDKSSTQLVTSLLPASVMQLGQSPTYRFDASEFKFFVEFVTVNTKFLFREGVQQSSVCASSEVFSLSRVRPLVSAESISDPLCLEDE